MSLQIEEKLKSKPTRITPEKNFSSEKNDQEESSTTSETSAPSPKKPEEHTPKCPTRRTDQEVGTQPPVNIGKRPWKIRTNQQDRYDGNGSKDETPVQHRVST